MTDRRQATENELVALIRERTARSSGGVRRGIGDDCAVLEPRPGTALLATTDLLLEDVHFRRRWMGPADIGWKAMAVNVSDIAAMGGRPRWALVALACPVAAGVDDIEAFYAGALELCDRHDVVIVGGDTSRSAAGWMVNVTLLGESVAPILRSTARPGDVVAVTGTLGAAAAGLAVLERGSEPAGVATDDIEAATAAHRRPRPRVDEAHWLGESGGVTAMMDLSDGIATDLPRLLLESGAGAVIHVDRLPVAVAARAVADALAIDPLDWATGGGEDYELLVTCRRDGFDTLRTGFARATGSTLTAVGDVTGAAGARWLDGQGRDRPVAAGFEHFRRD